MSGHMSIVSDFVIMRVKFSALVVGKPIGGVIGKLEAVDIVLISSALFIDNP